MKEKDWNGRTHKLVAEFESPVKHKHEGLKINIRAAWYEEAVDKAEQKLQSQFPKLAAIPHQFHFSRVV